MIDWLTKIEIRAWNVKCMNEKDNRLAVRQMVLLEKPDILCFQERKICMMNNFIVKSCGKSLQVHACLDERGTRGGILIGVQN